MKENNKNRERWLNIRVSHDEFEQIQKNFFKTDQTKISTYARQVLLGKPLIGSYRNRSLEDLITELIKHRNELNKIGINFNQAVHKLHITDTQQELFLWIQEVESDRRMMLEHTETVKELIKKIAQKWLL